MAHSAINEKTSRRRICLEIKKRHEGAYSKYALFFREQGDKHNCKITPRAGNSPETSPREPPPANLPRGKNLTMAMLLRRRLPLIRLLRPLQTLAAASTASSPQLPPLQKPVAAATAASPSVALGSRLGLPGARPRASASNASAFLAAGAAAALAMLPTVAYADANEVFFLAST